ncbi:NAD(P)H-binding protein [Streptosporangium sp. NPDC051022]|uniref:SDR family oxidoreductase n=1 Tax=Streptosporangium sp. NPDC051022 TaxID=3155752 RepID=UPI003421382E
MIAVTGAAGKTGRAVLDALDAAGLPARPVVRRPSGLPGEVVADLLDPAGVRVALRGCEAVYHMAPNVHPEEERIGRTVIAAAVETGARLVFHSVLHPQLEAMPHHWAKLRVEEALIESPLTWTIVQPAPYLQNLLPRDGELCVPYRLDAPFSLVHLDDVAEVAARLLADPGLAFGCYELAGPATVTVLDVARALGVPARRTDVEEWRQHAAAAGLGGYAVDALAAMFAHYDRHGLVGSPRVLSGLLGRAPRGLSDHVAGLS